MDSAELDEDDLDEDDDLTTPIPSYHKLEGALPPSIANSAPTPPSASASVKKKPFLQTSGKVLPRAVPGGASPAVASSRNMLKSFLPGTRLLSKAKRTLTGKGGGASRGGSGFSFDDGGIGLSSAAQNLVAGRKERQQRKQAQSEIRKNAVKNALYACIEDDDDVVSVGFSTDYYGQKKEGEQPPPPRQQPRFHRKQFRFVEACAIPSQQDQHHQTKEEQQQRNEFGKFIATSEDPISSDGS